MGHNFNCRSAQQQCHLAKQAQKVDANHFFYLLTDPRMLETVEAQLPAHRERLFPPTLTLAMFLGQIMSADGSCQNAVNEVTIGRLLAGMEPGSGSCQGKSSLEKATFSLTTTGIEPRAVKRRPKPYPRLDRPRQQARIKIEIHGHAKKVRA